MGFRRGSGDPPGGQPPSVPPPAREETEYPAIDVFETAAEVVIEAELPGTDARRVAVSVGDGLVLIEGEKEDPGPGRVNYLCMERGFGPFRRTVALGRAVDASRATATYRDGILQVRLPRIQEKRGRSRVIPVQAAPATSEEGTP